MRSRTELRVYPNKKGNIYTYNTQLEVTRGRHKPYAVSSSEAIVARLYGANVGVVQGPYKSLIRWLCRSTAGSRA